MQNTVQRTLIIAEAGVNHNGSMDLAYKLVDAAVEAGADLVKFQTFSASKLVTRSAQKAEYQKKNTEGQDTQFAMLQELELKREQHQPLIDYCKKKGIQFLSTPFDIEAAKFLINDLGLSLIKVPSGELTNAELLLAISNLKCPIIVSTGMANLNDIENALGVIAFGFLGKTDKPSQAAFKACFASPDGQAALKKNVSLLHCTTQYPAPFEDVNLAAIATMKQKFGLPVGYSDHTSGISVSIASVALGATIIEKHFTLDQNLPGPDHKASLEPKELKAMILGIREIELARGNGEKVARPSEIPNIPIARKSLVAAKAIVEGETFSVENLTTKRPGNGVSAMEYWDYIGKKANRSFKEDEFIS